VAEGFGDKQPPSNASAEEAVIASILIQLSSGDSEEMDTVVQFLRPKHFQREVNGWVYEAMVYLHDRQQSIDQISVARRLHEMNRLVDIGGAGYLSLVVERLPTSLHLVHYAHIVHNLAILRRLIHIAGNIAAIGYEGGVTTIEDSVQRAQDVFDQVWTELGETPFVITDVVKTLSKPPQYAMKVNGSPVIVDADDFFEFKRFKRAVGITCDFMPLKYTDNQWTEKVNRLMRLMKMESAPREASVEHGIWQAAIEVLKSHPFVETKEEFDAGLPIQKGDHIHVQGTAFLGTWAHRLKQTRGISPDVSLLWGILKKYAKTSKVRFGKELISSWQLQGSILNGAEPDEPSYRPEDLFI
jgi:hypothetical protein